MKNKYYYLLILSFLRRCGLIARKNRVNYAVKKRVPHTVYPFENYTPNFTMVAENILAERQKRIT